MLADPLRTSPRGLREIATSEGWRASIYRDIAGKATIGHGHLVLPGEDWTTLTPAQGWQLLESDVYEKERQLWPLLIRRPSQAQFDAMISLVFNVGVGIQDGKKGDFADSDLLAKFNNGAFQSAADAFLDWCKYRDKETGQLLVNSGLLGRRQRERLMFLEA